MASTTPNTITLKGCGIRKESAATESITPGALVEPATATTLQNHGTAGGNAQKAFAVENDLMGDGIDTAYTSGNRVQYEVFPPGAEVYALVAAAATAITFNAPLESAGDGTLRIHSDYVDTDGTGSPTIPSAPIVAYAKEAVDNSGGGTAVRIKIEVA